MLETIKQSIKNAPFITFEQYFIEYVMQMQDTNIDNEVTFMLHNNSLTTKSLDKLINSEVTTYDKLFGRTTSI